MPKINVYLPDDLAEAVKETRVPVSAVCQQALGLAVKRITAVREAAALSADELADHLPHATERTRSVLALALDRARADSAPQVTTAHLLGAVLAEGTNLALHVLKVLEIPPSRIESGLQDTDPAAESADPHGSVRFSPPAAAALELAASEAVGLGHNYVGCEHLLLGLVAEPDGAAGRVLRDLGAELRLTRRTVSAALAGYVHLRAQTSAPSSASAPAPSDPERALAAALQRHLQPLLDRVERLEQRVGPSPQE
ncbi:ATP-dependent Clp protease ATP-binding subunit [Streptomonospora sp. S1-112]|uniref:ATP-dependent Clp protease ATP-binding subunit n=1 Tax=Streptomonospora mangrovi TaxID=2883123 RepID=A0A9X3SE91_9ACTN|nr:Clp protease N-terminal domain-containing protein [Streptomonospora mangrovi]MDA0564672.1 ATP-dependent Clp protease ATP-binding subunit [Streptomonospora mangrovi]